MSGGVSDITDLAARHIGERGYWTSDELVDRALAHDLAADARALVAAGAFAETHIGRGPDKRRDLEVRGDRSSWIRDWSRAPVDRYRAVIEALRVSLARTLFVSARWFEAHYALYPPGARYAKHKDQHPHAPHRLFTCILYLSEHADGQGELLIYDPDAPDRVAARIEPRVGRFACLTSARMPHEVAPSRFDRLTLTGWLRDDDPHDAP